MFFPLSVISKLNATRRSLTLTAGALALGWCAVPVSVLAQAAYPSKTITIVVPFPAGGTTDFLARQVGQHLSSELGQAVVIENKAGAGGNIGSAYVAQGPADGYTLLMGTVGTHSINASLYKKMPFDPAKDFAPISRVASVPNVLVSHPSQPFKSVKELIAYAKANPGRISFASAGNGTSPHVAGELFKSMTDIDIVHVPYRGSGPALTDLLGNQVAINFENLPTVMSHVRSGRLRAIAVTTSKRAPGLPDVPTIAESGVPGFEASSWFGLFAPAATPAPVLAQISRALTKVLDKPEYKNKVIEQGGIPASETTAQFSEFIKSETRKWSKVVRDSGATVD